MPAGEGLRYAVWLLAGSLLAGSWLAGRRPAAIAGPPAAQPGALLAATGAQIRPITAAAGLDGFPAFSPDGRRIAFMRDGRIWLVAADGSGARALSPAGGWDVAPVFAPDGRGLAYIRFPAGGESQHGELRLVDLHGRDRLLIREPEPLGYAAFSPDGRRLAYTTRSRIKFYDLESRQGGTLLDLGPEADLLPGGIAWSPDGGFLVYGAGRRPATRDGRLQMELFRIAAAGGTPEQLTRAGGIMPDFSPDGTRLVYRNPRRPSGIYELHLAGGQVAARLPDEGPFMYFHPRWSPDGRRLVVSRLELPRDGGDRPLVSRLVLLEPD